jgi:heat shock protein HslJ
MKFIGTIALFFFTACQSTGDGNGAAQKDSTTITAAAAAQPQDSTTLGGRWYLQPVLPSDTAAGKTPWIDLDLALSRFTGNSGCNSMHGKFYFSKTDSSLSFNDKIAIAKMVCPGYNEPAFLKSLKNTARYRLHNGTMTLIGDDHADLSKWIRKQEAAPKVIKT